MNYMRFLLFPYPVWVDVRLRIRGKTVVRKSIFCLKRKGWFNAFISRSEQGSQVAMKLLSNKSQTYVCIHTHTCACMSTCVCAGLRESKAGGRQGVIKKRDKTWSPMIAEKPFWSKKSKPCNNIKVEPSMPIKCFYYWPYLDLVHISI